MYRENTCILSSHKIPGARGREVSTISNPRCPPGAFRVLLSQICRPCTAGFAPRDLVHPISPSLFTCNFVWVDATPEKRVLPASGDTDNRHRLPTHAAGGPQVSPGASLPGGVAIRGAYPRRRRAPCLRGPCRHVETLPYKPVCGVRLIQTRLLAHNFINRTPQTGLYGSVATRRHDPPKQGARRLRG